MPLTFEEPTGRRQSVGRRPSASSPYPVRVMTSIKPASYPSPFRVRSGSSASSGSQRRGSGAAAKDPFLDSAGDDADAHACERDEDLAPSRASEHPTCSPQEECLPSRAWPWATDPERQPLLSGTDSDQRGARRSLVWTLALALTLALIVTAIIALGIFRMAEDAKTGST